MREAEGDTLSITLLALGHHHDFGELFERDDGEGEDADEGDEGGGTVGRGCDVFTPELGDGFSLC